MDLAAIERAIVDTAGAEPGVVAAYLFGSVAAGPPIARATSTSPSCSTGQPSRRRLRGSRRGFAGHGPLQSEQAITHARAIVEFAAAQMA
jgi:hypothetical protein